MRMTPARTGDDRFELLEVVGFAEVSLGAHALPSEAFDFLFEAVWSEVVD